MKEEARDKKRKKRRAYSDAREGFSDLNLD